jgi:RNA-directed DNA polymerase
MRRTPGRESMSHGLDRVREAAKQRKQERFTALLHHVDVDLLRSAYGWLRKEASAGVDGVTWAAYGEGLERRLTDLHDRIHRASYRAATVTAGVYTEAGRAAAPLGHCRAGGQGLSSGLTRGLSSVRWWKC